MHIILSAIMFLLYDFICNMFLYAVVYDCFVHYAFYGYTWFDYVLRAYVHYYLVTYTFILTIKAILFVLSLIELRLRAQHHICGDLHLG